MRRAIAIVLLALAAAGALWWWQQLPEPLVGAAPAAPAHPVVASLPVATAEDPASPRVDAGRAPAIDPATEQLLRVRVVDGDKQPIEGAEVETFEDSTPGVVRTNRDGDALLPGPIRGSARRLFVRADNRHRQGYYQFRSDLTITLPWYGPVRGRVVDLATGTAIPGTVVTRHHNYCKHCEADRAVADANGAFELPAVPRNEDCVFVFTVDGYARQYERLRLPGSGEAISHVFSLRRGEVVSGRCVDLATKRPLAGARVLKAGDAIATTAADGSFRALVLPDNDAVSLQFGSDGHCRVTFVINTPQLDPSIEYPLPTAATLSGRVTTSTATPIAGARVNVTINGPTVAVPGMPANCQVEDEDYGLHAITDAAGAFSVRGFVPGGTYRVRASHADHEPPSDDRRWGTIVELKDGAPPVELVLVPKASTSGTGTLVGTFRCNGEPRAAVLSWVQEAQHGESSVDPGGILRSERLPAGRVQVIVVPRPFDETTNDAVRDAVAWRGSVDVVAGEEVRLDIVHEFTEATIAGRVAYADGAPAPGRTIWALGERVRLFADSGDDGRYVLRLTPAIGKVTIGCGWAAGSDREVKPGAIGVDFVVPRPATLRVRMRHADGSFADANISCLQNSYFAPLGSVPARDPDGWVVMPIDEGTHSLLFTERGYAPEVRAVTVVGTASVEVALIRGVDATLRLKAGTASPPADLVVQIVDAALGAFAPTASDSLWRVEGRRVRLTPEGETIRALGPGTHRLFVRDPAIEVEPATFVVDSTPVTIDVTWRRRAK